MCDCLWYSIGICEKQCKCEQYLSMNSDRGSILRNEFENKMSEVMMPVVKDFAEKNGYKEV